MKNLLKILTGNTKTELITKDNCKRIFNEKWNRLVYDFLDGGEKETEIVFNGKTYKVKTISL